MQRGRVRHVVKTGCRPTIIDGDDSVEPGMHPVQMKMARAALDLSVDQMASKAGISHLDVQQLESGGAVGSDVEGKARAALEAEGIEWLDEDGVRFKGLASSGVTVPLDKLNSYNDE